MPDQLFLSHDGEPVGQVSRRATSWTLTYDASWIRNPAAFPLSPHLPLRAAAYDDGNEDGLVEKYFDNLLPEGDARDRLAQRLVADSLDSFELLARFGRETSGAITISDSPNAVPNDEAYRSLPAQELASRIARMRLQGGSLLRQSRMSLAGAQDKLAVRFEPAVEALLAAPKGLLMRPAEGMLEPLDQAPTTHILKPEPPASRRLAHTAVNELFCMRLGRALGVDVPLSHLLSLQPEGGDQPEALYVVKRFDRQAMRDGRIKRLHQVDFLQLRNEWPTTAAKYELSGGARMPLLFRLAAQYASIPAASIQRLLSQRLLSFLLGNSDAHWKNYSLIWTRGHWDVSPCYDLVCTVAYPWLDSAPAMTIGGCTDEERIQPEHFKAFHEECLEPHGSKIQAVRTQLNRMAAAIGAEANKLMAQLTPLIGDDEESFLRQTVLPVIRHRAGLALDAAGSLAPVAAVPRRGKR